MEKAFPGIFKRSKYFAQTLLNWFLNQYIHRAYNHSAIFSKTQCIHLGLSYIQHSNTPELQHAGKLIPAEPIISDLDQRTKFSILKK